MPFDGLPDPTACIRAAFKRGIAPPPERDVSAWADAERILGDDEGPKPGRWSTAHTPYLREPMDAMGLRHPSLRVTLLAGAQCGKTQAELNFIGQIIAETPTSVLWVLPTWDEAKNFNRDKLEPMLQNTPAVGRQVADVVSRDESGSTVLRKRFTGGVLELVGANSSRGLQSRTRRVVILDEVAEFPADAGGRGDPVAQAEARTIAWGRQAKIVAVSTPGLEGECKITALYNEGSRATLHVACPHCSARQELVIEQLRWTAGSPGTALYHCAACGAGIPHSAKKAMLADAVWVHERPELVNEHPSYRLNALYSPFSDWPEVARQAEAAKADPKKQKPFSQQWLGRAYKPTYDVPTPQLLWERREDRPRGRVPAGVLFLQGATDVQGDRLEWDVYGFDRRFGQWWIDGGVLLGDPTLPDVWREHDKLIERRWQDAWGRACAAECWAVDSGYLSQQVYRYVFRRAHRTEPRLMAIDGRHKWGEPPVGMPVMRDIDDAGRKIGAAQLWPIGTWDIKSEMATAMQLTVQGPDHQGVWPDGAMRFSRDQDITFFEQLTAEALVVVESRQGYERREWRKIGSRNERFDTGVYARALARHATMQLDDAGWDALAAQRLGPPEAAQPDLASLWAPDLKAEAEQLMRTAAKAPPAPPPAPPPRLPEESFFEGSDSIWG